MNPLTRTTDAAVGSTTDQSVCASITTAVAEAEGVDVTQLDPLYYSIDPDRLEQLFDANRGGTLEVEFVYHGYDVRVDADGDVDLSER